MALVSVPHRDNRPNKPSALAVEGRVPTIPLDRRDPWGKGRADGSP
jgi:hypothetical protein